MSKRVEKEEITTTAGGTTVNRSLLSIDYASRSLNSLAGCWINQKYREPGNQ